MTNRAALDALENARQLFNEDATESAKAAALSTLIWNHHATIKAALGDGPSVFTEAEVRDLMYKFGIKSLGGDGWQDISTCKTDGTKVILWAEDCGEPNGCMMGVWDGEKSWPYLPCKWSKWRPLPAPPANARTGGGDG